jgi:hypothetical protein
MAGAACDAMCGVVNLSCSLEVTALEMGHQCATDGLEMRKRGD